MAKLNHKHYYFSDSIVSFPFGHPFLSEIRDYKSKTEGKMEKIILEEEFEMLKIEVDAISKNESLRLLRSIIL